MKKNFRKRKTGKGNKLETNICSMWKTVKSVMQELVNNKNKKNNNRETDIYIFFKCEKSQINLFNLY